MPQTRLCLTLLALAACKGDRHAPAPSPHGVEPSATPSTADAQCPEAPLFPARSLGEGHNDLFRAIAVDDTTHELFFTDMSTLYTAPAAGGEPRVALERKGGMGRKLWLQPERVVMPGSDMVLDTGRAVLYTLARPIPAAGAKVTDLEGVLPQDKAAVGMYRNLQNVRVLGDALVWYAEEGKAGTTERTHTFFTTSWAHPGEPRTIYTSSKRASYGDLFTPDFVIAGGKLWLTEETKAAGTEPQVVIDLETGAHSSPPASFNGVVIGGDEHWVIVRRDGMHDTPMGAIRMRADGTAPVSISDSPHPHLAIGRDAWAVVSSDYKTSTAEVATVAPDTGARKRLGCIGPGATIHAVALGNDAVYVSVFRDRKATILRYAR